MLFYSDKMLRKLNAQVTQRIITTIVLTVMLGLSLNSWAGHVTEYERQLKVKAAFIMNLVRFSQWQDKSVFKKKGKVELCLYQYNFLYDGLKTLAGKKLKYWKIQPKVVKSDRIIQSCDIILVPASALERFLKYNDTENLKNKITITDLTGENVKFKTLENKIIFRLIRKDLQIRFEVNTTAAQRLNIGIGSELLKLGVIISEPDRMEL